MAERLAVRVAHGDVPTGGTAARRSELRGATVGTLLCFEQKKAFFVEIDFSDGDAAFIGDERVVFEDVVVEIGTAGRRMGFVDAENVAEIGQERLRVGALGRGRGGPLLDELMELHPNIV